MTEPDLGIPAADLVPLVVDLWRLSRIAEQDQRLSMLCSRILDRVRSVGYRCETLENTLYDENAKVRVIEHRPGPESRVIIECLTPSVYWNESLLKEATVITKGQA